MQSARSRIWTPVAMSISYDDNHYTMATYIGMMIWMFANYPGDMGSMPGRVIPKTQKMVLNASLLNIQQYKVGIKSKVEQSRESNSALPYALV